uniref:Uncharacterized protein n=1 Tax=Chlamydomonas leiostraca TaxID=1034604 RepID=A0A7S0RAG7_9CHLO|mmetsp:Transcript_17341/g.43545  ORF Transcript_17341/g.43545 Transcript_17341/m.43545 type:complete len:140 (+) Transcript_17341:1-420(+)
MQPPAEPVRLYRDMALAERDADGEGPRLAPPVGYSLLFRDSSFPALTLWRPLAPRGYADVGCVAWHGIEEPPLDLVRCVRRDLVVPAALAPAPVWAAVSSDNQYWRVWLWEVAGTPCHTFLAAKTDGRPAQNTVLAPMY